MLKENRKLWYAIRLGAAVLGILLVLLGVIKGEIMWAALGFILLLIVYYFSQRNSRLREAWLNHYLDTVVRNIERANNYAVQRLPVGIAVFDKDGKLQWKNRLFAEWVGGHPEYGALMQDVLPPPDNDFATLSVRDGEKQIRLSDRAFSMMIRRIRTSEQAEEDTGIVVYLLDITDRERQKKRYEDERMAIAYLQLDNYSYVMKGLNESTRANLSVEVTKAVSQWADEMHGLFLKYAEDLYMVSISKKALAETINRKFDVLDKVREIKVGNKIPPTVSIGLASGERSLQELSQQAQSCLDLALGRGGDQAVLSRSGEMVFFGAKGTVQAKNTRVRARIVAQAVHELMLNTDKVFIMGHVNEDYDSLGASLGVAKMAMDLGKETYIVTSGRGSSLTRMEEVSSDELHQDTQEARRYTSLVMDEEEALKHITGSCLLVLVDHHRAMLTASPRVLEAIPKRIVIDHHRKAEDAIREVILQYMEPSTSSTSELVTELLQYFDDRMQFSTVEATALYAGILVDTKNFAVQTGDRTFEAAAFLRRNGADPRLIVQLFKDDPYTIKTRAKLITEVQTPIPGVALSVYRNAPSGKNTSVIVAQTADELLTMDDVRVSVVLAEQPDGVGISARSDGSVNVQVMMEELGGGGHQTVAGVRVKGESVDNLIPRIIAMAKIQLEESDKDEGNTVTGY